MTRQMTLLVLLIAVRAIEAATELSSEIARIEAQCSANSVEFSASSLRSDAASAFTPEPVEVNDEGACQMMCCTLGAFKLICMQFPLIKDTCNAYIYEEEGRLCNVLNCPIFDSCFKSIQANQAQKKVVVFGGRFLLPLETFNGTSY